MKAPHLLARRAQAPMHRSSLSGPPVASLIRAETASAHLTQEPPRGGGGGGGGISGGDAGMAATAIGVGGPVAAWEPPVRAHSSMNGARVTQHRGRLSVNGAGTGTFSPASQLSPTGPVSGAGAGPASGAANSPFSTDSGTGAGMGMGAGSNSNSNSNQAPGGAAARWTLGEAPSSLMQVRRLQSSDLAGGSVGGSVGASVGASVGPGALETMAGGGRAARGSTPNAAVLRGSTGALPQMLAAAAQQHASTLSPHSPHSHGAASLRSSGGSALEAAGVGAGGGGGGPGAAGLYSMRVNRSSLNGAEMAARCGCGVQGCRQAGA